MTNKGSTPRWNEAGSGDYLERFTREEWENKARWITGCDDYRLWVTNSHSEMHSQAIWFDTTDGRYTFVGSAETRAFDPQFPGRDQEGLLRRRITCDWKVLMDALFAEEIYVGQRHPGLSFYELGEQGIREIFTEVEQAVIVRTALPDSESSEKGSNGRKKRRQVTSEKAIAVERHLYQEKIKTFLRKHCRHTGEFKPLYAAAFQERLRFAFSREGVDLYTHDSFTSMCNPNQQLDFNIEGTGCRWMMESRLERLQAFADGIWKKRFGEQE